MVIRRLVKHFVFRAKSIMMSFDMINTTVTNFEVLKRETYLKMIENAVGTRMFCSMFVRKNDTGEIEDILRGGDYSCAFFVSSVLLLCKLMNERVRTTVNGIRENLTNSSDWKEVSYSDLQHSNLQHGDVVFWEKMKFDDGSENEHVGLVLNQFEAISTSDKEKMVVKHHITFGFKDGLACPVRKITQVFRYKFD